MQKLYYTIVALAAGAVALAAASDEAAATRNRVALGDLVGVAGAAVFGPTYRTRRWSDSAYFQFYQPRHYRAYPLPRKAVRDPMWGTGR
jgi:hypothetical protein